MANVEQEPSGLSFAEIEAIYKAERDKRLLKRPEGEAQFIDVKHSEKFGHLGNDPWTGPEDHVSVPSSIKVSEIRYLIVGAGYSGLLFAARLLEAGAKPEDLVLVDASGGFGGVWYWNRYPGLMCDVESYIYMPLLEETGYMPKHKYAYGPELRGHANRIADHYNIRDRAIFRQEAKTMKWDAAKSKWLITTVPAEGADRPGLELSASFVLVAGGQMTSLKIPAFDGLDSFKGHYFHTSRWDYDYTGGSGDSIKPELDKLKDKTVGIIGTGATAVQVIPELAKYAKQLFVFQRTPSAIDVRDQRETNPQEWAVTTSQKGWWLERCKNFASFMHHANPLPAVNMVSDAWVVNSPLYGMGFGYEQEVRPDKAEEHVARVREADIPQTERLRRRVDEIVTDRETAESLKHWYPSWCKRPCFHDEYLPAFNKPNVTLVDTAGRGVDRITEGGVVANGVEHKVDVLVLATGYKIFGGGNPSPAARFGITVTGKDGLDMDAAYGQGVSTLHGLCRAGFPNMFFSGGPQASLTGNQIMSMNMFAKHVAYVITEGQRRANTPHFTIEATQSAQEAWSEQVAAVSTGFAVVLGCTPNYFNQEGDLEKMLAEGPEVRAKASKAQLWGRGINHYVDILEKWRDEGSLSGFNIQAVQ